MALIMRRAMDLRHQVSAMTQLSKNYSDFRPLYSVNNIKQKYHDLNVIQSRFANTSSGYYAPSTVASTRRMNIREPHGNLNVFEDSEHLPSLPVPSLTSTLEKLKESISPVAMNSTELVNTLLLIDEFAKIGGPKLDLLLRNKADQTKNWLTSDWWTNDIYLRSRKPLVINSNPSMIYPTLPFEVTNQRALISFISQLVSSIIDFKIALAHGYNPEATSTDNECRLDPNICYNQYKSIFGSTRIPEEHIDRVETKNLTDGFENEPFNFVISYRGKFFEVQLNNIEDEKCRVDKISGILDRMISSTADEVDSSAEGPGVLTTANRDEWAEAFKLLDGESMNAIKEAQFIVCIDTISSKNDNKVSSSLLNSPIGSEDYYSAINRQILHGDGENVGNRWFDKSFQLIVVADEKAEKFLGAGINYEHSVAEGTVVTKLIEYSFDKTIQKHRESSSANLFAKQQLFQSQEPAMFRQLRMFTDNNMEKIQEHLKKSKRDYLSQVEQFDLCYLNYNQYGSNAIKSWHFSPDSWFQVALQSAYFDVHKRFGPCYESASTRRFAYGRTETIRSLTKEVAQFCLEPRFDTMQAAVKSHKNYSISACNGEAIDRALLGYKKTFDELKTNSWIWGLPTSHDGYNSHEILKLSKQKKSQLAEEERAVQEFEVEDLLTEEELNTIGAFFNNPLIQRSIRFALSTSQVSSIHPNICMSYGPLLLDGYGCCYNITGQQIVAAITANSSNQFFSCEVEQLNRGIRDSLDRMRTIVEEQRSKSCNN